MDGRHRVDAHAQLNKGEVNTLELRRTGESAQEVADLRTIHPFVGLEVLYTAVHQPPVTRTQHLNRLT